jgi:hypothetical protein
MQIDSELRPVILSGGAVVLLGLVYFVLRFRISRMARGRGVVATPAVDRRNREALESMGRGEAVKGEGAAPEGLVKAVDEAEGKNRPSG